MNYATHSYIGTRQVQEDCAGCAETENGFLAVVCDGIGSRANGGESSRMAVRRFIEAFRSEYTEDFPQFITKAAERIDHEVFEAFGSHCGTTVVAAFVQDRYLYWLSVGDSRLYIVRDGRMRQITTDHNYGYVLELRKQKQLIDEATYQKEQKRSGQLASFIGMGGIDIVDVSMNPILLQNGDKLLLTTDGLYKPLAESKMCDIILSADTPQQGADALLSAVRHCEGSLDNTTFTLVFLDQRNI